MQLKRIQKLIKNLTERKQLIAIAESCTGGYISHMITNISGASKVFERAVISYSNAAKVEILNVNPEMIEKYGAVSKEVAEQMATNIRELSRVDLGIGITGIAGPTGGTPEKPVGLVYIGFSTKKDIIIEKFLFKTDRLTFKEEVLKKIISFLEEFIKNA